MIRTPIIWNVTYRCYYNCDFCCIGANNSIPELTLEEKLRVLENLDSDSISIDFSGGEPLIELENLDIIKRLSKRLGRNNISLTSTGKGLEKTSPGDIAPYVREVEITYDFPREGSFRPKGYNENNLKQARRYAGAGTKVVALIPLIAPNSNVIIIRSLYEHLKDAGVAEILPLRFSESGRGESKGELALDQEEIKNILREYKRLEKKYGSPRIIIRPPLIWEPLKRVFTSLNITPLGLLLSNPWAYEEDGSPKRYAILGDLTKNPLSKIAGRNVYERILTQLKRNILR